MVAARQGECRQRCNEHSGQASQAEAPFGTRGIGLHMGGVYLLLGRLLDLLLRCLLLCMRRVLLRSLFPSQAALAHRRFHGFHSGHAGDTLERRVQRSLGGEDVLAVGAKGNQVDSIQSSLSG